MKVTYKTKTDKLDSLLKNIKGINGRSVEVGCIEGDHKWLAHIHEYGCEIKAKNGKYLAVPCHPSAVGKSPRAFSNLFFLMTDNGTKFLARERGKDKLDCMFWLTPSVKIPERAFLRNGHDENIERVLKQSERIIPLVIDGSKSVEDYLDYIGEQLSTAIKTYATHTQPNSGITVTNKGGSTPLADTGAMINGITYRKK